ncbi:protein O-mannosyl-transferase 2 isoform X3 [Apis laboriosa]|uniref:protein O-mannosyl-transferase 2 isoform X3 n=1 Tax=Apis laboriosa TaxID=183418 RepID=UPI001CC731AC|nr:protein O-mannosyl-transferase 2 isoform X3 [Apis laboriosa]
MKNISNSECTHKIKNLHKISKVTEKRETTDLNWWLLFGIIIILTAGTRFYKVTEPQHVCWDETHFGKMGSWYINRTFFFDVHPPLGKMLIALSGYVTGYDGTFPFEKPGDKFENVKYVGMRIFCTFLGATIVPLSYLIIWDLTKSIQAATFSALFILFVGFNTAFELWRELGDLTKPIINVGKHLLARCICLIFIPIFLYMLFFYIHLTVLSKSGSGDGFYSSEFQSLLEGNSLYNATMPRQLAYGATITLKNHRTGGGYLHSHWHLYPEGIGARQQQITTYSHKDDNNLWLIKMFDTDDIPSEPILVKHGDLIRLEHVITHRNLHSHKEIAPISKKHYQVTGYGENGTGDANDVWKVLIANGKDGDVVETVTSKLKFVHCLYHCVLTCSGKTLPKWAYSQQEVSCNPNMRDKNALWNIEDNNYAKLPNVSFQVYAPRFLDRFLESHAVMLQGNSDLKVKEGEVSSRPWQWPINYRGQFFSGNSLRIYLLGNPIIWWGNIIFLILFIILYIHACIRQQRGCIESPAILEQRNKILNAGKWLFIGWILHYAPFWAMTRVLYFHHYFPALLYSSMLSGTTLNYILESLIILFPNKLGYVIYHTIMAIVISSIIYSFYLFSPLAYGMIGPSSLDPESPMHSLRWMDTWEF